MATRLYFDTNAASLSSYPASSAVWAATSASPQRRPLGRARYGSNTTLSANHAETTATNPYNVLLGMFVSKPLSGDQTITGTFKGLVSMTESNSAADMVIQTVIRVFSGDMTTERGVLYGGNTVTTVTNNGEFATVANTRSLTPQPTSGAPSDTSVSSVAALSGDVIVVEIGYRALNTVTTSYTGTMTILTGGGVTANPDATTMGQSSSYATWIEFSQDLLFEGDLLLGDAGDVDLNVGLTGTLTVANPLPVTSTLDVNVNPVGTLTVADRKISASSFKTLVSSYSPYVYWPLDEGTGTTATDASGNSRSGTITAGTTWVTPGGTRSYGATALERSTSGSGARWTGTIPTSSSPGFTVVLCVYMPTLADFGTQISVNTTAWSGLTMHQASNGTLYAGSNSSNRVVLASAFTSGTWHCVAYRQDRTTGLSTVYIGGARRYSATHTLANAAGAFMDWANVGGTTQVQHVAFYNTVLSDAAMAEITGVYVVPTVSVAGSIDANVGMSGTLSLTTSMAGSIDVPIESSGALFLEQPLAGEISDVIDLTGTGTFTVPMAGEAVVDVSLEGSLSVGTPLIPLAIAGEVDTDVSLEATLFITSFVEFAGDLDAEVGLDAHLTVPPRVWVAGDLDIPVDLYGDSFEESFKAGTLDAPVDLTATATITTYPSVTNSTLLLTATTVTDPDIMLLLEPQYRLTEFFMTVGLASQAPLPVPNVPESASDTDPATATGLVLRPLGGVIVDMDTPTIQNGLPQ